jgi:hypothetical protein
MPLKDPIGLPEGKYLFIGDVEFAELAGQPIMLSTETGERIGIEGTIGHTPIELRLWRIESSRSPDSAVLDTFDACRQSGLFMPEDIEASDQGVPFVQLIAQVTIVGRQTENVLDADPLAKTLELVQRLQTAYHTSLDGPPVELLTREQLPLIIPMVISPGPPVSLGVGNLNVLVTQPLPSSERFVWPETIDDATKDQIILKTGMTTLLPGIPFFEFRNDARVQLHRYGNYRQSIVATAAGIENLVNTILELMLWEEGTTPVAAAAITGSNDGVLRRVRREFPRRLGGSWNPDRSGPMRGWVTHVLRVRNHIVHGGSPGTRSAALSAIEAANGFVGILGDRFAKRRVKSKYPRTVILSLGRSSLERRQAWTPDIEALRKKHEWEWRVEFASWRQELVAHLPD